MTITSKQLDELEAYVPIVRCVVIDDTKFRQLIAAARRGFESEPDAIQQRDLRIAELVRAAEIYERELEVERERVRVLEAVMAALNPEKDEDFDHDTAISMIPELLQSAKVGNDLISENERLLFELDLAKKGNERLNDALIDNFNDVYQSWKFTGSQQHAHSWHDREDCLARMDKRMRKECSGLLEIKEALASAAAKSKPSTTEPLPDVPN